MIRSLRWRLVAVTMALLTVVMGLAIFLFLNSTYRGIENDSLHALHQAGMRYGLHPSMRSRISLTASRRGLPIRHRAVRRIKDRKSRTRSKSSPSPASWQATTMKVFCMPTAPGITI